MKNTKGFTLIELLVVIAIIALLSSVVLASLSSARMKSRDARRIADFDQIRTALEMYFDTNGYYPGTGTGCAAAPCWDINAYRSTSSGTWATALQTDLSPYIAKLPTDPLGGTCDPWVPGNCYSYAYGNVGKTGINPATGSSTVPNTYSLVARLETPNHPQACKKCSNLTAKALMPVP